MTRALDRHHVWILAAIGLVYFAVTGIRSRATPFWHDEIYTLIVSRLPSVADIWRAARTGADAAPPLNLLLTHAAESLAGHGPNVSRSPAMIGFCVMCVAVFYLVRARSNVVLAFAAVMAPWYTRAYRYSYEARGYGVMLGLFALLLLAWTEAARGHRRRLWLVVFATAAAASIWNHYFAVLTFIPIVCGEMYRWARRGSPDWGISAAAAAALLCCVPLFRLARQAAGLGATYWRHTAWSDIGPTYSFLFHDLWSASPWLIGLLAAAALIGFGRGGFAAPASIVPGHEVVAGAVALAIPVVMVAAGRFSGAFTARYALSTIVAGVVVVPLTLWWISRGSRLMTLVLVTALAIGVFGASLDTFEHPPTFHDPFAERPLLIESLHEASPTVVGGAVQFLQLWYYAPPELRSRLWYIADPARSEQYLGSDTADRGYVALSRLAPMIDIKTYEQLTLQRSFTLYDDRTGWLPRQLQDAGAVTTVAGQELGARVLRVTLSAPSDLSHGRSSQHERAE